jgi:chromosome segregation ATPase
MSEDIVTRLRDAASGFVTMRTSEGDLMREAADEIERLRKDLVEAEKYNGWHQQGCLEIEWLRADVKTLQSALDEMQNDRDQIEANCDDEIERLRKALGKPSPQKKNQVEVK